MPDYSSAHSGAGLYLLKEYRTLHQRSVYSRAELPFCFYFENTIRVTVRELRSHSDSDPTHDLLIKCSSRVACPRKISKISRGKEEDFY